MFKKIDFPNHNKIKGLQLSECLGLDAPNRMYWADNVAITAGSGTSIATDDVGGVHFQKIKINLGGDGADGSLWDGSVTCAGDVSHGSADSGNPVKVGAKYSASLPSLSDGQRSNLYVDSSGRLIVVLGTLIEGEDQTNHWLKVAGNQTDDAAFTPGSGLVFMLGAEFDNSGTDSVDEGDGGAVRMSGNRNLYVSIRDNAGNERGLNIDSNGALAATVTNATAANLNMTEASAASIKTAVELIDDIVQADDAAFTPATSKIAMIGAEFDDTGTDSVDEGDGGAVRMSANRNLYMRIRDNAGNERGANVNANSELFVIVAAGGSSLADGATNGPTRTTGDNGSTITDSVYTSKYNGSNWDRTRNNMDATLLSSAARTATPTVSDQTNYEGKGVMCILNVTANPGGGETLSLKIQGKDSISGTYFDIADAGVLFTAANGIKILSLYPGILAADAATGVTAKSGILPRTWRAVVTHSASGSWTYSLSAVTML